ncbi:MAG TPA: CreA family protein [Magnetospirillaceae bacterium]|jgi:CreA protein
MTNGFGSFLRIAFAAAALLTLGATTHAFADEDDVGSVNTEWKLIGPDHKVVVSVFDDPVVPGVACYISRARTGGISGMVGLAEDSSDAAIACRQVGAITIPAKMPQKDEVFSEHRSIMFKHLRVVRFFDKKHNTLVYLSYSDKLIKGSPQNSVSAVPVMPWPAGAQ